MRTGTNNTKPVLGRRIATLCHHYVYYCGDCRSSIYNRRVMVRYEDDLLVVRCLCGELVSVECLIWDERPVSPAR